MLTNVFNQCAETVLALPENTPARADWSLSTTVTVVWSDESGAVRLNTFGGPGNYTRDPESDARVFCSDTLARDPRARIVARVFGEFDPLTGECVGLPA